jgi:hypothetical protein
LTLYFGLRLLRHQRSHVERLSFHCFLNRIQSIIHSLQTRNEDLKDLSDPVFDIATAGVSDDAKGSLASGTLNKSERRSGYFNFLDLEACLIAVWAVRHAHLPSDQTPDLWHPSTRVPRRWSYGLLRVAYVVDPTDVLWHVAERGENHSAD